MNDANLPSHLFSRRSLIWTAGAFTALVANRAGAQSADVAAETAEHVDLKHSPTTMRGMRQDTGSLHTPSRRWQRPSPGALPPETVGPAVAETDPRALGAAPTTFTTNRSPQQFMAQWAADDLSVDVRHIMATEVQVFGQAPALGDHFTLTPQLLERLCDDYAFDPMKKTHAPFVLFALRGAHGQASGWVNAVEVSLSQPDHLSEQCLMGVWYRGDQRPSAIQIFRGSTVPHRGSMAESRLGGDNCNLSPTGLHRFQVEHHDKWIGAFRQMDAYPAHRLNALNDGTRLILSYTNEKGPSTWPDVNRPSSLTPIWDDVHPTRHVGLDAGRTLFSSEGCQVVEGNQSQTDQSPTGQWADFRTAAGLIEPPSKADYGIEFDYLLLNGREAHLAAHTPVDSSLRHTRLRLGSSDQGAFRRRGGALAVSQLQTALSRAAQRSGAYRQALSQFTSRIGPKRDGKFDGDTMRYVLVWQFLAYGYGDGVVDSAMQRDLELS